MTAALLLLMAFFNVVLVVVVVVDGRRTRRVVQEETKALDKLRLDSRARISTLKINTAAEDREVNQLRRLGRATFAKRKIVGGDPNSDLHTSLQRTVDN